MQSCASMRRSLAGAEIRRACLRTQVAGDGDLCVAQFADLGSVDVDMDDAGVGRELRKLARWRDHQSAPPGTINRSVCCGFVGGAQAIPDHTRTARPIPAATRLNLAACKQAGIPVARSEAYPLEWRWRLRTPPPILKQRTLPALITDSAQRTVAPDQSLCRLARGFAGAGARRQRRPERLWAGSFSQGTQLRDMKASAGTARMSAASRTIRNASRSAA